MQIMDYAYFYFIRTSQLAKKLQSKKQHTAYAKQP